MTTIPDLDEEIDFLQSVIDKQQVVEGNQASESHRHWMNVHFLMFSRDLFLAIVYLLKKFVS